MNDFNAIEKEHKKLTDKIEAINQQIATLTAQRNDLNNQMIGVQLALKHLKKPTRASIPPKISEPRPDSDISKVLNLLRESDKPLHIDEILKKLEYEHDKRKKVSLVGSLTSYIRNGRFFKRYGPNVFGLLKENFDE